MFTLYHTIPKILENWFMKQKAKMQFVED